MYLRKDISAFIVQHAVFISLGTLFSINMISHLLSPHTQPQYPTLTLLHQFSLTLSSFHPMPESASLAGPVPIIPSPSSSQTSLTSSPPSSSPSQVSAPLVTYTSKNTSLNLVLASMHPAHQPANQSTCVQLGSNQFSSLLTVHQPHTPWWLIPRIIPRNQNYLRILWLLVIHYPKVC